MSETNVRNGKKEIPFSLSMLAVIAGILGAVFGITGGIFGVYSYFQTEQLAEETASLSKRLAEDANTYIALQTRISSCNGLATHHHRQAEKNRTNGYIEEMELTLPDGSIETMSSNHQRFIASVTMGRALSMCLVLGGNQDLVRECISDANSGGFDSYPRRVIDSIDDNGNGLRNLAC